MTNAAPPAWYPDPADPSRQRWWDGTAWGPVAQPSVSSRTESSRTESSRTTQPGGPPPGAKPLVTPDGAPLADYWPRVVAYLIDGLLLMVVQVVLSVPFYGRLFEVFLDYGEQLELDASAADPLWVYRQRGFWTAMLGIMAVGLIVSATYSIVLVKTRNATVGKSAMGLRIRPWQADGPLTWGQATKRWLSSQGVAVVVGFYVYIDLLWPAWDERRQALHDKWPGTVVVQRPRR